MYAGDSVLPSGQKQAMVVAQCECGNINVYIANHVKHGRSNSCGCFQLLLSQQRIKHGHKRKEKIRGTKVYSIWQSMLGRCKTIARYINNGITVCDEWKSFDNFYKDMGDAPTDKHTLDRIENDKGYFKGELQVGYYEGTE